MPIPLKTYTVVRPGVGPVAAAVEIVITATGNFIDRSGALIFVDQETPGSPSGVQVHAFAHGVWEEFHVHPEMP